MCRERGPQLNRVCQNGFKTSHFMIFLYADKIIPVKKKKRKFTEKRDNCMSIILEYTRGVPKWRNFFFFFPAPCGSQLPTKDQTCTPCCGKALTTGPTREVLKWRN